MIMNKILLGIPALLFLAASSWAQSPASGDAMSGFGLGSLPYMTDIETRLVSPENPTGERGKGGMAIPDPTNPDLAFSKSAAHLGQGGRAN